jgi:uncharacterized protein
MTIILAFILLTIIFAAMSVGVILGRKPITGSCGGVGAALGEKNYSCEICGDDPQRCEQQQGQQKEVSNLAYDATK